VSGRGPSAGADLLATIVAATQRAVEVRAGRQPIADLDRRAAARAVTPHRFVAALSGPGFNVIAECKRRSPSKGVLRKDYDPVAIARGYAEGGAAAISVLTETTFFDGSLDHLRAVRAAVGVPLLRKDFIVTEYQIVEARATGADAVLLIVAALSGRDLRGLMDFARQQEMDVLVEVHDDPELEQALEADARLIGVNNRNLRTLAVDVAASERLIAKMPDGVIAVSESGLKTADDLVRLSGLGYRAFLMGERFMTEPAPGLGLQRLLAAARARDDANEVRSC